MQSGFFTAGAQRFGFLLDLINALGFNNVKMRGKAPQASCYSYSVIEYFGRITGADFFTICALENACLDRACYRADSQSSGIVRSGRCSGRSDCDEQAYKHFYE